MRKTIKMLIKVAAIAAVFFLGAPLLSVLIGGFLTLKSVDIVGGIADSVRRHRMSAKAGVDKETVDRNIAVHKENTSKRFFDERNGQWNLHDLPLDMFPTVGMREREAYFTCAGVSNVVKGEYLGGRFGRQKVRFSMVIDDASKAEGMANYIAENGLVGTAVSRTQDGRFDIVSDNAVDINTLVKEFYPPRTMKVNREIRTTRQYVVSGCRSYEEALAKFKANRFAYSPANCFTSYQDTVDGVADHPFSSGPAMDTSSLQVGEFVINETSWEVYSRNVTVNGGVDCTEESLRSLASDMLGRPGWPGRITLSRENDLVEDKCSGEPVLSDGLEGRMPERYILYDGNEVRMPHEKAGSYDTGASLVLRFSSVDELRSVVSGDTSLRGHMVLVDSEIPEPREGEFILSVPADRGLVESLKLRGSDPESVAERYDGTGLTVSEIHAACVMGEIRKSGYVSAELIGDPDFSGAMVNGVPLTDFNGRVDDLVAEGKIDQFENRQQAERWLRDAAKIQSVHMDLDLKNSRLVITSTVGTPENNVTKVETRQMEEDELRAMASRGVASDAEMKDLLIRMHPDFFETYRKPGTTEGRYHDPVGAYIRGVKPRLTAEVEGGRKECGKAERGEMRQNQNRKAGCGRSKLTKYQNKI